MTGIDIDVSQVKELAARLAAIPERKHARIAASVKKGAQNIKTAIQDDVAGSSNEAIARIPIAYEMKDTGLVVEADIAPRSGGAGSLANLAFFGTSKGGGTHRFYEHGEEELDATARYVKEVASDLL
ncbi:hypothetical protein BBSC_2008 [Bifidobacterium scardovii JCM 12489 = DSM 13734]|uniref:HK97 gp10 family phage protein n=2 Tax=Bifidobacterium scardovii TaxID=158787 RepID=A0A087DGN2_9BIFI|nr:hypothetical protein BSCA_0734 [Bifidobacterium scardovii]BAQ32088.1 hypothetical protein BBSC_2008 [Bifidobacterium scardovii JCM 12489 = DSM 13734]DAE55501.1 MAG TPA: hypothetical protein [Caudoviricetes sp.]